MKNFGGEIAILVRFYALYYFGYVCLISGHFLDFLNYGDYIDQPQCLNFYSMGSVGVS